MAHAQIVICPNCEDLVTWSNCTYQLAFHYAMYYDDIDRGHRLSIPHINEQVNVVKQGHDCMSCSKWDYNFVDGGKAERELNSSNDNPN